VHTGHILEELDTAGEVVNCRHRLQPLLLLLLLPQWPTLGAAATAHHCSGAAITAPHPTGGAVLSVLATGIAQKGAAIIIAWHPAIENAHGVAAEHGHKLVTILIAGIVTLLPAW
jgi:hypothetical protein